MFPDWEMAMFPFASIAANSPPEAMLHVGVTVSWLYLATTIPEVPYMWSEPSMTNWLSYDTVIAFVLVLPPSVQDTVSSLF